ncbi:hypothetical protein D0Y65_045767 [Glycine soja]|uniref:Uncharacterized protein n=1 Tax=Glycine soja TaxID=3848 RepID=A0A445G6I0_GLYSO|nr:hypothetical protein D0Y65_045767 [Glycine soja]
MIQMKGVPCTLTIPSMLISKLLWQKVAHKTRVTNTKHRNKRWENNSGNKYLLKTNFCE